MLYLFGEEEMKWSREEVLKECFGSRIMVEILQFHALYFLSPDFSSFIGPWSSWKNFVAIKQTLVNTVKLYAKFYFEIALN